MTDEYTCEYCETNHRTEDWELVPCFESIVGTIVLGEVLKEES